MTTTDLERPVLPEERGRMVVADRVVEKVAGYAVTLVSDAGAPPRRVLGVNVGEARPEHAANVEAEVHGAVATVRATISVRWPRSIPEVVAAVRQRIRSEVTATTGVRVDYVDVDVTYLSPFPTAERRVT
jgi:uncharacterized alkaline shock family protein YloU